MCETHRLPHGGLRSRFVRPFDRDLARRDPRRQDGDPVPAGRVCPDRRRPAPPCRKDYARLQDVLAPSSATTTSTSSFSFNVVAVRRCGCAAGVGQAVSRVREFLVRFSSTSFSDPFLLHIISTSRPFVGPYPCRTRIRWLSRMLLSLSLSQPLLSTSWEENAASCFGSSDALRPSSKLWCNLKWRGSSTSSFLPAQSRKDQDQA